LLYGYQTTRMRVQPWAATHLDGEDRNELLKELSLILSARVTKFLPDELRYVSGTTNVETWITSATAGSTVFLVRTIEENELAGVLIVHESVPANGVATMRLGYLFGEHYWRRGLATELVRGLVDSLKKSGFTGEVLGGVEAENAASAAVLLKSGFVAVEGLERSAATQYRRVFP
jgi:RimJ/RimL family protein N-acetyltransferase